MNREFALSLLTSQRDLLKKILEYNHLDEKVEFPSEILNSASAQRFTENHSLVRKLAKASEGFFEFDNPANRLCFFSEDQLVLLSKLLSASICSQILISDIKNEQVIKYREYLGEELYSFGLRRGSLYFPGFLKSRIVSAFSSNEDAVKDAGNVVLKKIIDKASPECKEKILFTSDSSVSLDLPENEEKLIFGCVVKIICLELDEKCQNIFS